MTGFALVIGMWASSKAESQTFTPPPTDRAGYLRGFGAFTGEWVFPAKSSISIESKDLELTPVFSAKAMMGISDSFALGVQTQISELDYQDALFTRDHSWIADLTWTLQPKPSIPFALIGGLGMAKFDLGAVSIEDHRDVHFRIGMIAEIAAPVGDLTISPYVMLGYGWAVSSEDQGTWSSNVYSIGLRFRVALNDQFSGLFGIMRESQRIRITGADDDGGPGTAVTIGFEYNFTFLDGP